MIFIHTRLGRRTFKGAIPVPPPLQRGRLHSEPHRDGYRPLLTEKKKANEKRPHGEDRRLLPGPALEGQRTTDEGGWMMSLHSEREGCGGAQHTTTSNAS